jgi:phosphoenolpyruvate synthase/pyruvate phosphate dikinase
LTESKILQEAQDLQVEKDNKGEQPQESSSLQAGINLSKRGQIIASILRITEKLRDRRKHANLIGSYGMWQFLDEVQRRTNIDRSMTKRAFYFEFQKLLENPQQTLKLLRERDSVSMVYDGSDLYYYQEMTIKESKKISDSKKTIEGTPASPGIAKGEARAVLSPDDFEKFNKGDILVTEMTKPEYMPVIKKADAILAKEGGLTSHAAIISRELKIPCIVGLDRLSTQLGDGDRVEVDADEGVVKKIG